jgi:stage IV sporulation protein FB
MVIKKIMFEKIKLMTICNIPIYLHWDVIIFVFLASVLSFFPFFEIDNLTVLFLLYFLVAIHEFAHGFVATLFGYSNLEIDVFILGGLTKIDSSFSKKPKHEFWIVLAGPFVNFLMALFCYPFMPYFEIENLELGRWHLDFSNFLLLFFELNVF